MRKNRLIGATLAGLAAMSAATVALADPPGQSRSNQCFYSQDWDGWKATPDSKAIYIRVGVNKIWRLDLSSACPALQSPNPHLINTLRGGSTVCSALDLDLKVADDSGFATPCIVSSISRLSDAEASALPKNLRP